MKKLNEEVSSFLEFLRSSALPGFSEFTKDQYEEDYQVAFEVLAAIGKKMRLSAAAGKEIEFRNYKDSYYHIFSKYNTLLAKEYYNECVENYLDEGFDPQEAQSIAVGDLWGDPRYNNWLPARVVMKGDNGKEVDLVGQAQHAIEDRLYVTIDELKYLKRTRIDPWKYVQGREREGINSSSTGNDVGERAM